MFRRLALAFGLASSLALSLGDAAEAAVADGVLGARAPFTQIAPVEKTQFFFGGQNYCWYDDGWQGPGYYYCGYAWRRGYGWGGGAGWRGWGGGGRRGPGGFHGGFRGGRPGGGGHAGGHGGSRHH